VLPTIEFAPSMVTVLDVAKINAAEELGGIARDGAGAVHHEVPAVVDPATLDGGVAAHDDVAEDQGAAIEGAAAVHAGPALDE
jgi:hypothetical protein